MVDVPENVPATIVRLPYTSILPVFITVVAFVPAKFPNTVVVYVIVFVKTILTFFH